MLSLWHTALFPVVNLSQPQELWFTLVWLLQAWASYVAVSHHCCFLSFSGTSHWSCSWTCLSLRRCGLPWSHCYIAAFSLFQAHNAIPGPRSVPAQELWLTLGVTATLLLYPFLRHTMLFLVLDLSQPQELWFTLGVTATLLLSPFLSHTTLFLVLGLSQRRSCG